MPDSSGIQMVTVFYIFRVTIFLGPHHMEFIFDLLVLPEGPRLRDKLSHGEVDLSGDESVKTRLKQSCQLIMASIHDLVRVLTYIVAVLFPSLLKLLYQMKRLRPVARLI